MVLHKNVDIIDYQEKYQELLDRQDLFQECEENGTGAEDQ